MQINLSGKGFLPQHHSIWVCMNVPNYLENCILSYSMEQKILAGVPKRLEAKENYDLIQVIQICLGKEETHEQSLLEMLRVLFSNRMKVEDKKEILSSQYGMIMETGTGKEIDDMCNFADYIEEEATERGMKKGLERGLKQGIEQGIERGIEQGVEAFILDNLEERIPKERIVEKLQRRFHLTEEEAETYFEKYAFTEQ